MKLSLCVLLVYMSFAAVARADAVTLKSGDRINGTMLTIKGGNLELKSDVLGDLTIPLAQVASFSAEKPAAVMVKGEKTFQGQLQLEPSGDVPNPPEWHTYPEDRTPTVLAWPRSQGHVIARVIVKGKSAHSSRPEDASGLSTVFIRSSGSKL